MLTNSAEFPVVVTGPYGPSSISSGSTATFTVTATGDGTITYQWITNSSRIALASGTPAVQNGQSFGIINPLTGQYMSNMIITGATSSSYTTPILLSSDTGIQFSCFVLMKKSIPINFGTSPGFGQSAETVENLFSVAITNSVVLVIN